MIVLDTNVLSELMRAKPSSRVRAWISVRPATTFFVTSITEAEILYGLMLMPAGRRRNSVQVAVEQMFQEDFRDRVLPFDSIAAEHFAVIAATRRQAGRPISQPDGQIAAIARSRGAAVATRNVSDFQGCNLKVIDPWEQPL